MAINVAALNITLDGTGTEIPTLNVTDPYEKYYILGNSIIATGNYAIVPTGTPQNGTTFIFKYRATLDITSNSKTFSIFGQSFTQNQLNSALDVECYYDGTSWEVEIKPSFTSQIVEATNIVANAITAAAISNSSIDLGVKGIIGSLVNNRIANNTIVASQKIQNLSITDALINDVDGSKIAANSIANAKLAQMANNTIKGNISGSTGNVADISIATVFNSNGWSLTGNSGTTPGTNFIGTTDNQNLVFKRNSTVCGLITLGAMGFGVDSLKNNTGSSCLAYGEEAGQDNTGDGLVALGTGSAQSNSGDYLTAVGGNAGISNTSLAATAVGYSTVISGDYGIALGFGANAGANEFALPNNVTKIKWRGVSYTLPSSDGTAGQALLTDGAGTLYWG